MLLSIDKSINQSSAAYYRVSSGNRPTTIFKSWLHCCHISPYKPNNNTLWLLPPFSYEKLWEHELIKEYTTLSIHLTSS